MKTKLVRIGVLGIVVLALLVLSASNLNAAPLLTCNSTGSTNWNTTTTWSCGRVPTAADDATILAGHTVSIAAAPTNGTILSLTVNGTLNFSNPNSDSLTVSGNMTVASGGSVIVTDGGGTNVHSLTVSGNLTNSGTMTLSDGINDSITLTLGTGSVLTVNGTVDFGTNSNSIVRTGNNVAATLTMGASGLIRTIDATGLGPVANASFQNQGTGTWTMTSLDTNGTVEYYNGGAQTITDRNYNNLTLSTSGTKTWTLGAARAVNGTLTLSGTAGFTLSNTSLLPLTVNGNWTHSSSGAFSQSGGGAVAFGMSGTATLSRTVSAGLTETFCNLTVNVGTTLDTGDDFVAVTAGAPCGTLTVSGVLRHTAPAQTVTSGGATVSFNTGRNLVGVQLTQTSGTSFGSTTVVTELNQASFPCGSNSLGGTPVRRFFNITPTTTGGAATVRLYYATSEGNPATVNIFHCDPGTSTWSRLITGTYTTGSDGNGSFVQLTGVTTFSPFAISGGVGNPTAVTLSSFDAATESGASALWLIGLGIGTFVLIGGSFLARKKFIR